MKIALLFPNNSFTAPYLSYYIDILKEYNVSYDLFTWNRFSRDDIDTFTYNKFTSGLSGPKKIMAYFGYRNFLIKRLKRGSYKKLIVFSPQLGLFLEDFLSKRFKGKYILDVRDFSNIIEKAPARMSRLVTNSSFVALSSQGFTQWLPQSSNYIFSHNVNQGLVTNELNLVRDEPFFENRVLNIDTIGQIKDFDSDSRFVEELGNDSRFLMNFIGFGPSLQRLEEFAQTNEFQNTVFHGPYQKEDEKQLLDNTDFLNILISRNDANKGSTLLSNRLYLSALYKIPCIVNQGTEQSRIVEKYNMGIAVSDYGELSKKLITFKKGFNKKLFLGGCHSFLQHVLKDQQIFEKKLLDFIKEK